MEIENEEFWWMEMDQFTTDGEFSVVIIDRDSLKSEDADGLKLKGSVKLGDWDALAALLNPKEADLHKIDFSDVKSYVAALYCDGEYVTTIKGED